MCGWFRCKVQALAAFMGGFLVRDWASVHL